MAARERLIALVKALNEYTDEEHPLSAGKLCAILAQHGIAANRRSIYADVAALNRMGWCNVTRSVSKMTEIERRGGKRWDKPKKAGKSRDCRGGKF